MINSNNNSLHLTDKNKKTYLTNYHLNQTLKEYFLRKGFFINQNTYIIKQKDLYIINVELFYRTKLLIDYRRILEENESMSKNFIINNKKVNILIHTKCLNRPRPRKKIIKKNYKFFKKYKRSFFERNHNLWLDFIKTTDLIANKHLGVETFLYLLGSIFKHLNKRKHNYFKLFVFQLFQHLLKTYPKLIKGLKFSISGRIRAKPRAKSFKIESGKIDLTKFSASLYKSQMHVYTLYGAFGIKLYINYHL